MAEFAAQYEGKGSWTHKGASAGDVPAQFLVDEGPPSTPPPPPPSEPPPPAFIPPTVACPPLGLGVGAYLLGVTPSGHDPYFVSCEPEPVRRLQGPLFFDPAIKDFVLLEDGMLASVHSVDQEVAIRISHEVGTLGSVRNIGSSVPKLAYQGPDLEAQVRDRVRLALKPMLDRGDIQLVGVPVERLPFGGFVYVVEYFNLRLVPAQRTSFRPS